MAEAHGGLRSALAFLTTFGGSSSPTPTAVRWFPVVGGLIGASLAVVWWSTSRLWPSLVAAGLIVTCDLVITGMLHLDGLGDTADGLLPHAERSRRLEIMRQPDIGAFGVGVVVMVLILRLVSLGTLPEPSWRESTVLVGIWMASRTVVGVVPVLVPYARSEGLASGFLSNRPGAAAGLMPALGLVPAAVLCWWAASWLGVVSLGALLAGSCLVVLAARRALGGFTGDVLGASLMMGETAALVTLATSAAP